MHRSTRRHSNTHHAHNKTNTDERTHFHFHINHPLWTSLSLLLNKIFYRVSRRFHDAPSKPDTFLYRITQFLCKASFKPTCQSLDLTSHPSISQSHTSLTAIACQPLCQENVHSLVRIFTSFRFVRYRSCDDSSLSLQLRVPPLGALWLVPASQAR